MIACYCRVSTDEQAKEGISIDEQQNRLKAYCISQGWNDYNFYVDDGYSAKNTKRPQLQRLLSDIKKGNYEKVLVTKIDRFTRSIFDMVDLSKFFTKYKIDFCSATEAFDTSTSAGRMMLNILISFAQFERERISERVTENMIFSASQGKLQQCPCFGYNIFKDEITKEKYFILNEQEIKWALQIFKWFVEDNYGYMKIAKLMNAENIKTKRKGNWSAPGVRAFLNNELLIGRLIWNRYNTKGDKYKLRNESEWIIVEDAHKAIIPLDLWQQAQFKLSQNKPRGTQTSPHMLKGLIKCGHCNSPMVMSKTNTKSNKLIYICHKYRQGHGCFSNWVSMDEIEHNLIETIEKRFSNINRVEIIKNENISVNIDYLKSELDKISDKIDLQLQLLEEKTIDKSDFKKARDRILKEKNKIEYQINSFAGIEKQYQISVVKDILPFLKSDEYLREQKRVHLEKIIDKILIYNKGESVDIIYKVHN